MRIDLYATCWNEERMIPYFLRHYEPLVDRIVIFDDGSSDRSLELLRATFKVELRRLEPGPSSILTHTREMNRCWKESRGRADWVIIADLDEHFYHTNFLEYLANCQAEKVTILNPIGVEMISPHFPPPEAVLTETIRQGVRSFMLDKKGIFNPNAIEEINFDPGRHMAAPIGRIVFPPKRKMKLLHYKQLGLEYVLWRSQALQGRRTELDRQNGWGLHDYRSTEQVVFEFEKMRSEAGDIKMIGKKRPVLLEG